MTIKFTKTIEITGERFYRIYADNSCLKSFLETPDNDAKSLAATFYQNCIKAARENYPITETLAEETIDIAPKP